MSEKTYVITIEGQAIPVPPEIGADDTKVRAALAPYFPDAANALISRSEKDNQVTVNVTKKAGSKGAAGELIQALSDAPAGQNPAVALYMRFGAGEDLGPVELLQFAKQIDWAIEAGLEQGKQQERSLGSLRAANPAPATFVPPGF